MIAKTPLEWLENESMLLPHCSGQPSLVLLVQGVSEDADLAGGRRHISELGKWAVGCFPALVNGAGEGGRSG